MIVKKSRKETILSSPPRLFPKKSLEIPPSIYISCGETCSSATAGIESGKTLEYEESPLSDISVSRADTVVLFLLSTAAMAIITNTDKANIAPITLLAIIIDSVCR